MSKIRLLVVEDSLTVRRRLVATLEADSEIEVVGEASDGESAIALCERLRPDVISLDAADGAERWTTRLHGEVLAPPVGDLEDEGVLHHVHSGLVTALGGEHAALVRAVHVEGRRAPQVLEQLAILHAKVRPKHSGRGKDSKSARGSRAWRISARA